MRLLTRAAFRSQCLLVVWMLFGGWSTCASAQEEFLTPAPDEYRIFGTVQTVKGESVADATASLITLPTEATSFLEMLRKKSPLTSVKCDEDGNFDIRIAGSDQRWLAVSTRTSHLLVIQAPGYETAVKSIKTNRLHVDFPEKIQLEPCVSWNLKVVDQDGSVVPDIKVTPAVVSGLSVPYECDLFKPATSQGNGLFRIDGFSKASLEGVYLAGDSLGNHRVAVQSDGVKALAHLPASGTVKGSFVLPEGVESNQLAGEKVIVTGGNTYGLNGSRLEPISWAVLSLDDKATALASNICYGRVSFGFIDPNSVPFCTSMTDFTQPPTLAADKSSVEISQKLHRPQEFKVRFVDGDNKPVPNVRLSSIGASGRIDPDGAHVLRFPTGTKPGGQMFPFDGSEQYQVTNAFGVMLGSLKMVDDELEPIELTRSRSIRGRVIDENGQVVAGAKIDYTIKSERFTVARSVLSSSSGTFEIGGLPPNTNVALTASKGSLATPLDANITVKSGSMEIVPIPVVTFPTASFVGAIADQNGDPISGPK